jgi:hypothetical protein
MQLILRIVAVLLQVQYWAEYLIQSFYIVSATVLSPAICSLASRRAD